MSRPIVLTFVSYYLPGYKAGGPLRTIANMVDQLGDEIDFRIVSRDRDQGDDQPFAGVRVDTWNDLGTSKVFYASPSGRGVRQLASVIRATAHDVLYLNSYFDPIFTLRPLLARRMTLIPQHPTVLAPRGEFSEGALTLKTTKKLAYRTMASLLRLHHGLQWQASSDFEAHDIRRYIGDAAADIVVAPDLGARPSVSVPQMQARRIPGAPLRACFVSRISRKKNLGLALRILARVRVPVVFDVYGPREDDAYWAECEAQIGELPPNVSVTYQGVVPPDGIDAVFASHDLFLFPTLGENFGHVILESLRAGTPVLTSDTTPWRGLEKAGVGWDLPLGDIAGFVTAIERAHSRHGEESATWRAAAAAYARAKASDPSVVEASRRLFLNAARRK